MNTYTWQIRGFKLEDRADYTGVVNTVLFTIVVTDPTGQYSWSMHSEAYLPVEDLSNFTAFEQLDKDTVVQWIKNCYTVEEYAKTMAGLDKALLDHIADLEGRARIITELPWGETSGDQRFAVVMPKPEDYARAAAEDPLN